MELDLGVASVPSGSLLIVNPGYLNLWCDDGPPVMPEGVLSTPQSTALANSAVNLEIVGSDAEAVGRELSRQWNPRYLFDIPRSSVDEVVKRVADIATTCHLDARIEVSPSRLTHRRRIGLALKAGGGAGEVQFHGIWAAVLGDLPSGQLRIVGERMPEDHVEAGRLRRITILARDGRTATSERFAYAMVDWGRLLVVDSLAVASWKADEPLDGRGDFAFWGRDAEAAAQHLSAPPLGADGFGWRDLPLEQAKERRRQVLAFRDAQGAVFATDFRPHSHHYQLMEQVRASPTESGQVRLGNATACGFTTTWGDGIFEIQRDLDEAGRLLRARIELGTPERIALMAKLRLRWHSSAAVSRRVIDEGQPVRFMYREASDREADSGWRMFSGQEGAGYNDDSKNIAIVPLTEFANRDKRVDALLGEPVGSVFERLPGQEEFKRVTDWEPPKD